MSDTFLINNTANTFNFIIPPGQLNGPGGQDRDSDLRLYGLGTLRWGEGVDENLYRLLENYACPAKELGDYNPSTGNNDYNPGTDPILPKDENDLGPGNGVTTPVLGQLWYNTTSESLYVYESTGWQAVAQGLFFADGSVPMTGNLDLGGFLAINSGTPSNPQDLTPKSYVDAHIADASLHLTSDQNTFLDGLNLPTLTSVEVNQLIGVTSNVQTQIDSKVAKAGDTLTGNLTMSNTSQILLDVGGANAALASAADPTSGLNSALGVLNLVTSGVTRVTVNTTNIALTLPIRGANGLASAPTFSFTSDTDTGMFLDGVGTLAFAAGSQESLNIETNGTLNVAAVPDYETLVTADDDIPNKKYVDDAATAAQGMVQTEYTTAGAHTFDVPAGVTIVYVTGIGGGQGGQGGGDGGTCGAGGTPGQGGSTTVTNQAATETLTFRGGYQIMSGSGGVTPWTGTPVYFSRSGKTAPLTAIAIFENGEARNATSGNPERGGKGGDSLFGTGGSGTTSFGGPFAGMEGITGGGGAGGAGQDSLAGAGGCCGFAAVSVPFRVTPGETLTVSVGSGSNGTSGCRSTGGAGGDGYLLISY